MYTYICGQDSFRSRRALKELIAKLPPATEIFYFDASADESVDEFWLRAEHTSLFGGYKTGVILYPLSGKSQHQEALAKKWLWLSASINFYLVWEGSEASNFGKKIKNNDSAIRENAKNFLEFPLLQNSELKKFIQQMAKTKNIVINEADLTTLTNASGGNLWMVENELEKITLTGRLDNMLNVPIEEKIFAFTDAVILGEKAKAHKLLKTFKQAGFEEIYLLGALAGVLRTMLKIKSLVSANTDYRKYESLGLHPFVLKKFLSHVRGFRMEDLKRLYQLILQSDVFFKTAAIEPQTVLIRLISEF